MNNIQKNIVSELKDNEKCLEFYGSYRASSYPIGLSELCDDTPENAVYFTLHRDNVFDCEADCGTRTEYDMDGEEFSYSVCGEEGECSAVWDEEVIICEDGTINYNGELYNSVSDFLNDINV